MDITPDLSHLTEDERKIIEAVINRQKAEEKRDAESLQSHMDDYSAPVAMAGRRYSQQTNTHPHKTSPNESGVCCEICQKTKFVDEQSARQCSICKKRFCVRCGVRLKGHQYNKTFWLCNICRQKQESYFSSRKLIPTTSSVSQLTTTSINTNNINDENTNNISKQYVSDYILSQPFDTNEKEDEDIKMNKNGANKKPISTVIQQRKRILPTTHIRRQQQQQQKESKDDSSSEQDDGAVSSPDSTSVIDDNESIPRVNKIDEDVLSSLPISRSTHNPKLCLKEIQYHSLEDKDVGHETTLKDSGIDTASSSTILNVLSNDPLKKVLQIYQNIFMEFIVVLSCVVYILFPTTTWRLNENRTEQIGYVHLKNNTWTSTIRDEYEQGKMIKGDIFSALGLKIQGGIRQENEDESTTMIAEITKVTPGSIADNCGQLQIGDQVLEWNGQKLTNLNYNDVYRIISQNSIQSPDIHMIVKRSIRYPTLSSNEQSLTTPPISTISSQEHDTTTKKNESNIRLQLSFQYNIHQREFLVTVHGARDLNIQQGSFACQLCMQYGRDSLSKEQKCTKPQSCSSGICTWNQRLIFFDIDTLENLSLWLKLVDLDRNQDILGEICIPLNDKKLNLNGMPEWYYLTSSRQLPTKTFIQNDTYVSEIEQHGSSFNRVLPTINTKNELLPSMIDNTQASNRKRQLPNIPAAQLHANREKVSQDLIQKATQLKLRLHMQQQQRSLNETNLNEKRQMYEDRIQIFNNEANRSINPIPSSSSQRSSFQSSKSIDTDSSQIYQIPLSTKPYESMTNLTQKIPSHSNLKEKTLSRPRIPIIRDKSAPNTPHLNPALSRRTTSAGQHKIDMEKTKIKSFEEKHRKNLRKREPSETPPGDDVDSDGSELSTVSKISSVSMLSTQSERPRTTRKHGHHARMHEHHQFHRNDEVQLNEEELRQMAMRTHDTITNPQTTTTTTTTMKTDPNAQMSSTPIDKATSNITGTTRVDPRNDGTLSDSVLSTQPESGKKRRPSMSSKALVILGLSKKTNSTSNLGFGKRFGFQRSEEIGVQPHLRSRILQRQTSKENETPSSAPSQSPLALSHQRDQYHSMPHDMKLWSGGLKLPHEHQFAEFIENLGSGQLVGRQVLASPCHGEIQVGVRDQHGLLEVEIVRARNLLQKALYKMPPAPYVKVYLLDGKTCVEKQRTRTTRRTLDPLIQQTLMFKENYRDKVLQIGVWGDYGKLDRKVFMGVCQINLEDLHLSSAAQVLDWYRLFSANSLMNNYTIVQQSPKKTTSMTSNDSFSSFKNNSRS